MFWFSIYWRGLLRGVYFLQVGSQLLLAGVTEYTASKQTAKTQADDEAALVEPALANLLRSKQVHRRKLYTCGTFSFHATLCHILRVLQLSLATCYILAVLDMSCLSLHCDICNNAYIVTFTSLAHCGSNAAAGGFCVGNFCSMPHSMTKLLVLAAEQLANM